MEKIQVTRSSLPSFDEYVEEIRDLWDTHWLTNMGAKHSQLQEELRAFLGVENIELLVNGHMSLELALQAMELPAGGEVITTPFTFASTTHAIARNGLIPVFCDINPQNFTIDVSKIERLITSKTCAIMPVHVYGNICEVDEIDRIAQKHKLKVIYDAAHTFGMKYRGRGVGTYGDVSCFSFHATKVFHTVEGGAICYKNPNLGDKIYGLKNFGIQGPEKVDAVGCNAKMNELCAAMGICNLRHINEEILKRKKVVMRYRERLENIKGIRLNVIQEEVESNYAYFPILVSDEYKYDRDEICNRLQSARIYARKYFYPLSSEFECYRGKYDATQTPIAVKISREVLSLPLYADLDIESVDRICDILLGIG